MTVTAIETTTETKGKWLVLLAAFLGWMFDGLEMGLFPLVARPALQELIGPGWQKNIGTWFSIIMAVFLVGAAVGGIIFGWLGDRIGRVKAMVGSVLVYSIFSGLCGFSQSPLQLGVLRFMASLGMGGEWSLGVALVMEVWPPKRRPVLAGLIGAASNVGFLGIAFLGLALTQFLGQLHSFFATVGVPQHIANALLANSAWRLLLFLGATPALLTLFISILVPESKRWQQAAKTSPKNKISDVFQGRLAAMTIIGAVLAALPLLATWGSVQWIPAWTDKLAKDAYANERASVEQAARAKDPAVDVSKVPDTPAAASLKHITLIARPWSQVWSGFGAVIGCIIAAMFAQWTSRRWTYFGLCGISLLACQYLFRWGGFQYGYAFLFWVTMVGGLSAAFYGWLPLYLPELFPTRVRATGQGFAFNSGRVLAAAGTFLSGSLLNAFNEDYARMASWITLIYLVGLVVIWLGPETKGKPLPE